MAKVEVVKSKKADKPNYIWVGIIVVVLVLYGFGYIWGNSNSSNTTDNGKAQEESKTNKGMLYKISIDDFDYLSESIISFSESYTAKLDGESFSANVSFMLYNNKSNECYYSSQAKFNNGSSVTIQGGCTYNINNNTLNVDGTFNKLAIPSSYEQSMGLTSTSTKEKEHLECQVNGKGKSITCGKITYYNYTYSESSKRNSAYILFNSKSILYDINGIGLGNKDYTINLSDYEIMEVDSMPNLE